MVSSLLRRPKVQSASGLSRSTLYLRISQGLWTKPVSLGGRSVAWPENEITALNAARIVGLPNDEVRVLVKQLEASRSQIAKGVSSNEKAKL
ncbi:TPA: AlpA family phage regulatory protein [Legionella pneumophila subsp. pneumophila]|nr:AlpA family phage regulatory protein [Legionella pneumophila subsp. pneumophila]